MPIDEAQRLLAQRISGETGMGAIVGRFLNTLGAHGAECAPRDLDRLGRVAADLITACLAEQHDGAGGRTGDEPRPVRAPAPCWNGSTPSSNTTSATRH